MLRYFYYNSIQSFISQSEEEIIGTMVMNSPFSDDIEQKGAWSDEIQLLQNKLCQFDGYIFFEYSIPRLGKRVDVVLLIQGIVFCLEFKVGANVFERKDIEQVWDYALDLKNFHEASHDLTIVPILIATNSTEHSLKLTPSYYDDNIFEPLCSNGESLLYLLQKIIGIKSQNKDLSGWADSRYSPTPTIIQAASALYLNHSVADITRTEASGENLQKTTDNVLNIIKYSRQNREKSICFVTGVPGAGKTLVGLNVAIEQFKKNEETSSNEERDLAVYLSGNGPLVDVLTEALARDTKKRKEQETGKRYNITDARREVSSFIQSIHHYRDFSLEIIKKPILNDELEIDNEKYKNVADKWIVEHVAIFDEAQRCWDKTHLSNWLKRKKNISDFPMSEAEFLIWSLNLRKDWAVIVCLVGGGQEINTGEAGIAEWISAIKNKFSDWNIFISSQLTEQEYAEGHVNEILQSVKHQTNDDLHLAVSMRSFRAEKLNIFVHSLLDRDIFTARKIYSEISSRFPIILTRDLDKAKCWLRSKARGSERYGLVVSSQAARLKPLAIDVRCKPDTVHWFLDDINDVRSSQFLEDAASEFDVQGLELDYTCLVWDGDLRYSESGWIHKSFSNSKWRNINSRESQLYQINAYRVLLTRARQGMIICVPKGNDEDQTRLPEFYDTTYEYLKSLGLAEI